MRRFVDCILAVKIIKDLQAEINRVQQAPVIVLKSDAIGGLCHIFGQCSCLEKWFAKARQDVFINIDPAYNECKLME